MAELMKGLCDSIFNIFWCRYIHRNWNNTMSILFDFSRNFLKFFRISRSYDQITACFCQTSCITDAEALRCSGNNRYFPRKVKHRAK